MSRPAVFACPDADGWRALAAHRADPRGQEPAEWAAALAHLDGCPGCRRAALAADPTLLFRRLPVPRLGDQEIAQEVADMQRAVAALRTASRVRVRADRGWTRTRWAAAAALATVALSLGASPELHPGRVGGPGAVRSELAGQALPSPAAVPAALRLPSVEDLNRPEARIYQMGTVVMIVDEGLDV